MSIFVDLSGDPLLLTMALECTDNDVQNELAEVSDCYMPDDDLDIPGKLSGIYVTIIFSFVFSNFKDKADS